MDIQAVQRMRQVVRLYSPVQAHQEMARRIWPNIKALLLANHKMICEVRTETRSIQQNARLWAMLTAVSQQKEWYGQRLSPEDWKNLFTAALKKSRAVPGIDGGVVFLGQSTSKMTKSEMAELQTMIEAFAVENGIDLGDEWVDPQTGEVLRGAIESNGS